MTSRKAIPVRKVLHQAAPQIVEGEDDLAASGKGITESDPVARLQTMERPPAGVVDNRLMINADLLADGHTDEVDVVEPELARLTCLTLYLPMDL